MHPGYIPKPRIDFAIKFKSAAELPPFFKKKKKNLCQQERAAEQGGRLVLDKPHAVACGLPKKEYWLAQKQSGSSCRV